MAVNIILVPIDFSEASKIAVNYALMLAEKLDHELKFVHGYSLGQVEERPMGFDMAADEEKEARQRSEDFLSQFSKLRTVKYSNEFVWGSIVDAICETATQYKVDLIVMVTSGASDLGSFFIGTTSEKVSKKAPCPVLIVPDGLTHFKIEKLCFALKSTYSDQKGTVSLVPKIIDLFTAELSIVLISERDEIDETSEFLQIPNALQKLSNSFQVIDHNVPEEAISEFLTDSDSDMLILYDEEQGFFDGIFNPGLRKKLVFNSDIPLLILK